MLDRVPRALALGGGAVLLGMLALVLLDVIMRYALRLPFLGAYEFTELAMVLIVFLALPYCAATGGHVAVDVLAPVLDRPPFRWLAVSIHLAGAALLLVIAWRTVLHAIGSAERGEATNMMKVAHYPFELVAAASAAVFAAVLIVQAWRSARRPPASADGG
ncbi:MAG TPA: TRAP transporter small permease [Burkholderiales bacterium]|nr:TRAP transporter small permease [Burkholderiales bacterium]